MSSRFSCNYEAEASELQENFEDMLLIAFVCELLMSIDGFFNSFPL